MLKNIHFHIRERRRAPSHVKEEVEEYEYKFGDIKI